MNKNRIVEPLENAKYFVEDKVTPLTILFGVVACLLGVGLIYLAYLLISHCLLYTSYFPYKNLWTWDFEVFCK